MALLSYFIQAWFVFRVKEDLMSIEIKVNNFCRILQLIFYCIVAMRSIISILYLYPSPMGDSIIFLSSSANACTNGILGTPIAPFPFDTQQYKLLWHGFLSPYLYSALNLTCTYWVYYLEYALLSLATTIIIITYYQKKFGQLIPTLIACVVYCIQIKQGFRPETLAISLIIIADIFRREKKWTAFFVSFFLLAWEQPTIFIINTLFLNITLGPKAFFKELVKLKTLLMLLATNCLIIVIYPYPIIDLIKGLLLQGSHLSGRSDGSLFAYYIRSDFLPLFGLTFLILFCLALKRRLAFVLLLPVIYFYGLKAPPTMYNILPLYVSIFLYLLNPENILVDTTNTINRTPLLLKAFVFSALLALTGLLQGLSRDIYSLIAFNSNAYSIGSDILNLKKSGYTVCNIPAYTTAVFPKLIYSVEVNPTLKECDLKKGSDKRVDLIQLSGQSNISDNCKKTEWSTLRNTNIPTFFKTESGYAYLRCFN